MPAVITHDTFGREVYDSLYAMVGGTRDELAAFLLGNQGPDVLFFGALHPRTMRAGAIGSRMHCEQPIAALEAFRRAVDDIPMDFAPATDAAGGPTASAHDIARAYVMGLLCHYLLDSRLHPFVYAQQWELCDAGVEGLDRSSAHEVHAAIESELDELVLSTKAGATIRDFNPSRKTLIASDHVLNVISALYERVVAEVYGEKLPRGTYRAATKAYRMALRALWSPAGMKREALARIETLFRKHSFLRAMSHRDRKIYESMFDNREHRPWFDEDRGRRRTESFWDLYDGALQDAFIDVPEFVATDDVDGFLRRVTDGRNYNGQIAEAVIVSAESV